MFWEILIAIVAGVTAGTITGLMPGIHVNLISVFAVAASSSLLGFFSLTDISVFIIAMSITHIFLDTLPSIFLGAPDASNVLGVLPGHRYLLAGNGLMAVKLSIIGAYFSLLINIMLFPLAVISIGFLYNSLQPLIGYILIAIILFMVAMDNDRSWSVLVVLLSACLGILALQSPVLEDPLFPMLSGLFGISTLIVSINDNNKVPEQKISNDIQLNPGKTIEALSAGQFSGMLTAVLPGLGASTAAVIGMQFARKLGDHGFMILMSAINMGNFVLSIAALYSIQKARNGTIAAISEIVENLTLLDILIFLSSALIAASISVYFALQLGKVFSRLIQKVNYRKLVIGTIIFICGLVILFTGFIGFFVMVIATFIGLISAIKKVRRTHAMACLTVPVIMYYLL